MFWKTVVLALFVVGVFADELKITDEHKEQLKTFIRSQCSKANATEKVDDVVAAVTTFSDCIKELLNVEQLKEEIEQAKPNGALDEVFKKYCAKSPQLKTCLHTLVDGTTPCLDKSTKELSGSIKTGSDQLIDFVCYKDGDRIALFISEQGPECFREKMTPIRNCVNNVKDSVPSSVDEVKTMTVAERCAKYDELSRCIVTALESCTTSTPGNMAESLFRFVRKNSPCHTDDKN